MDSRPDLELPIEEINKKVPNSQCPYDEDDSISLRFSDLTVLPVNFERASKSFNDHDQDKDGFITYNQLIGVLKELEFDTDTDPDLKELLQDSGLDFASSHGILNLNEFFSFLRGYQDMKDPYIDIETRIRKAFNAWDTDGNGVLDMEEFEYAVSMIGTNLSKTEIEEMFCRMDINGNGTIEEEEFVAALKTAPLPDTTSVGRTGLKPSRRSE